MKRQIYFFAIISSVVAAFAIGMIIGGVNSKDGVIGVYQSDSWNGGTGTLVLYEDGSCQYPSGNSATWVQNGDTISIMLESGAKSVLIYIDNDFETAAVRMSILKIEGVEGIDVVGESNLCRIALSATGESSKAVGEISKIDGVKIVEDISQVAVSTSKHEAKIMESGLVLHGHFFEKVSD